MFDPVSELMRTATECALRVQRETFGRWGGLPPFQAADAQQSLRFQKRWAEIFGDLLGKQQQWLVALFRVAPGRLEDAFEVARAGNFEALWRKGFKELCRADQAQARDLQTVAARSVELLMKMAAYSWAVS